jgi:hypothetical protein
MINFLAGGRSFDRTEGRIERMTALLQREGKGEMIILDRRTV